MNRIDLAEGTVYPRSAVRQGETTYFLARLHAEGGRRLGVIGETAGFSGTTAAGGAILVCPLTPGNAAALRSRLLWLNPGPLGCVASFGFGDRIGSATPGHIQALRAADPAGALAPVFAQQSVRENARSGRTPQQVVDDAMWGVFQEGWRSPWGADADHIKTTSDLAAFVAAGYSFFTIDPGDHVDNAAHSEPLSTLRKKAASLPWDVLQASLTDLVSRFCRRPISLNGISLTIDETVLLRALAKYGRALAHAVTVAHEITARMAGRPFDLEISIDETDTPTSADEHFIIAAELSRCGVPVVSLAPRFVGKFQKGVDYIGDLADFEHELARHAAVMRHFGTFRLSIHTGSDKFSIYPVVARHSRRLVHVKTAGTSYLEALRVIAVSDPGLFRRILALSRARFEQDRKSYFLDARLSEVPEGGALDNADLPALLDAFDARQVLHVTFGSALDEFGPQIGSLLAENESQYRAVLEGHFVRHITPFVRGDDEPD